MQTRLPSKKKNWKYSFDTSAFIEPWKRHYPIDVFPNLWEFIENKITDNYIVSISLVKDELEYQQDELTEFILKFQNLFIDPDFYTSRCFLFD